MGIPSVVCTHAIWRGSWWCGRPFALLFDFEFLFPSEPHLFRQSRSQVQREGAGGGLRGQSSWLRHRNWKKRGNRGMDKTQGKWQISVGEVVLVKCWYNQRKSIEKFEICQSHLFSLLTARNDFPRVISIPGPAVAKWLADKQGTNGNWRK